MTDVVERYIEIAMSIFLYVTSSLLTLSLLVFAQTPIAVQGSDKTFIESAGVQQLQVSETYGRDILLMLLNTDPMSPYPKAIKINNTPVIRLTDDWIAYKMRNVGSVYSATGAYKLSTMMDYVVTKEEYVYKGADAPYTHYTLERR